MRKRGSIVSRLLADMINKAGIKTINEWSDCTVSRLGLSESQFSLKYLHCESLKTRGRNKSAYRFIMRLEHENKFSDGILVLYDLFRIYPAYHHGFKT